MVQNTAAWSHGKGETLKIGTASMGKPGPGQILMKNHAVAINPVDVAQLNAGMFVATYPMIFGNDVAGEVVEIGEGVTNISQGQRVLANSVSIMTANPEHGGFQHYTVAYANGACPIPDNFSFEQAVVAPLAVSTAAAGLYEPDQLALPYPSATPGKTGKVLLVWGGSSSVGTQVIQLAAASGFEVYATASKRNFDYCRNLGATEVFDYSVSSVVQDIVDALKGKQVAGAYDAISLKSSITSIAQILEQLGGGRIACVLPSSEQLPSTVTLGSVFGPSVVGQYPQVGDAVYKEFLPEALASGRFKLAPDPQVVGKGLESIEQAIQLYAQGGLSAVKLVVSL